VAIGQPHHPRYNPWDGTAFGTSSSSASVGTWRIIAGAACHKRDEKIVVGIDAGNVIRGEMWSGSGWSELDTSTSETKNQPFVFLWTLHDRPRRNRDRPEPPTARPESGQGDTGRAWPPAIHASRSGTALATSGRRPPQNGGYPGGGVTDHHLAMQFTI
jgi:hypothetical protein